MGHHFIHKDWEFRILFNNKSTTLVLPFPPHCDQNNYYKILCSLLFFNIYLFIWNLELGRRGREGKRESFLIYLSTPHVTTQPGLGQTKAKKQEFYPNFHVSAELNPWAIFPWFLRHINRELDQEWSSQDSSQFPYGMLTSYLVFCLLSHIEALPHCIWIKVCISSTARLQLLSDRGGIDHCMVCIVNSSLKVFSSLLYIFEHLCDESVHCTKELQVQASSDLFSLVALVLPRWAVYHKKAAVPAKLDPKEWRLEKGFLSASSLLIRETWFLENKIKWWEKKWGCLL